MKCCCCMRKEGTKILNVNGVKFFLCSKCKRLVHKYVQELKRATK